MQDGSFIMQLAIMLNPKYNQPYLDKNGSMLVFNGEIQFQNACCKI